MLDAKTILFSLVVAELTASAVLCFLFFSWKHRDKAGTASVGLWSVAFLLGAIGTCLLGLRGVVPESMSLVLAYFAILFATGLRQAGVAAFFGRPRRLWLAVFAGTVWITICQIPELRQSILFRTSFVHFSMMGFVLWTALLCLRWNSENLLTPKIYAFSAGVEASAYFSLIVSSYLAANSLLPLGMRENVVLVALLFILVSMVLSMFTSVSMPIEKSLHQLKNKTYMDNLTGLPNRKAIYEHANTLKPRNRNSGDLAVIRFDIDEFKRINDAHGQAMGDTVLKVFAGVCQEIAASDKLAGRLSGDEFAILCENISAKQAELLTDRIKFRFSEACLEATDGQVQGNLSAGISFMPLRHGFDEALKVADRAAYRAKRKGQDRTVVIAISEGEAAIGPEAFGLRHFDAARPA